MAINFLQMREPPILPVLHQLSKSEKDNNNNNNNNNDDGDENNDDNDIDSSFCMDVEGLQGFGNSNYESLGGLVFAFFRRYAHEFDYEEQVVSVRHGHYLTKEEKGWHLGRNKFSLCVEEPFNVSRNLGNSADQASVQGLLVEFRRACHLLATGASLDIVCEPYVPIIRSSAPSTISSLLPTEELSVKQQHNLLDPSNSSKRGDTLSPPPHMIHNNARRSTHPILQSFPPPTPLPSVVLPVHPHSTTNTATITAVDSPLHHPYDRHRSSETIFVHSPSVTSSPSSNHQSPYLQPIPIDSPGTFRPRFNSASSSTYSPPVMATTGSSGYQGGVHNMRHSSHPLTCCTAAASVPGMPAPIAITIALPPPTSSSYVSTLQQLNNKKSTTMNNNNGNDHHNRTVDSILARYSSKPPLPPQSQRPRSRNASTDYHHHRRNSAASNKANSNNKRRTSRQSSIDWPTISPTSSATLELSRQKQGQHQNNNRRRRWSTVKHDVPKKTMADVLKEQHRQEERAPKPSCSAPSPFNVQHHQKPLQQQQQQKQYRNRHRPSKTPSNSNGGGGGGRNRRKHNNGNSNNNNNNNSNNNSSNGNKSRH